MNSTLEIIDEDAHSFIGTAPSDAKIQLCDQHWSALQTELEKHGHFDSQGILRTSHSLTKLAINALGSQSVCEFRCPVCALQNFDYVTNVCAIYANA
jgi:hypothetical protein